MRLIKFARMSINAFALLLVPFWELPAGAQSTSAKETPGTVTADQQKMNAADRNLTAKIRRSVTADKSLSLYAHNVKIISQDGTVTLRGPVRSDDEVKSIVSKAIAITNSAEKVVNLLTVEPATKSRWSGIVNQG